MGVDGVLPAPAIKFEPSEANQPVMLSQKTPERLLQSTSTQPTRIMAKSNTNTS